jgi:hypothetical protein
VRGTRGSTPWLHNLSPSPHGIASEVFGRPLRRRPDRTANPSVDEPDALIAHVRICGRRGAQAPRRPGPLSCPCRFPPALPLDLCRPPDDDRGWVDPVPHPSVEKSDMKRRFFSRIFRQRFETAWSFVPAPCKKNLRGFIRYVDEVSDLQGVCIFAKDLTTGGIEILDGPLIRATGYCGYYGLPTREFCDVILLSNVMEAGSAERSAEGASVAVTLHELAHAHDFFLHRRDAANRPNLETEQLAWNQAVEWASLAIPNTALFERIKTYATLARIFDCNPFYPSGWPRRGGNSPVAAYQW